MARDVLSLPGRGRSAAWKWRVDVLTQKPAERTPAVTYIEMDKGSKEEYTLLRDLAQPFKSRLADRILAHMQLLHDSFPGEQVDRYVHSLQTATRAHRHGADEDHGGSGGTAATGAHQQTTMAAGGVTVSSVFPGTCGACA